MARGGKLRPTIVEYEIGVDISKEMYLEVLSGLAQWFEQSRKTKEPAASAKHYLDSCMKGVKPSDGTPWQSMAMSSLAARVRSACRYDIILMQPIVKPAEAAKAKRDRERARYHEKKAAESQAKVDPNLPKEYSMAPVDVSYGDSPLVFFTTNELKRRESLKEGYLKDFPQLRSVASEAKLDMLLDLTLLMERMRFRQAKDTDKGRATESAMQSMTKQIVELEKALNIHPDQLAKQQKEKEGGTIGEAVRRLDETNPIELREKWLVEELLVLYQMYHQKSPRHNMGGYQLDEVGLFGLTRCRTCHCSSCGTRNYAGLNIEEVEDYLKKKGNLVDTGEPADSDDEGVEEEELVAAADYEEEEEVTDA